MLRILSLFLLFGLMFMGQSLAGDFSCNGDCGCKAIVVNNEDNYNEVLKLSEKSNKNIILMFTGESCSWCKKQKEVFSNKEVSKKLEEYILCYVNVSKNKSLSKKHNVSSIPKCVMINKNEKVLKESNGYKNEKEFLNWLK